MKLLAFVLSMAIVAMAPMAPVSATATPAQDVESIREVYTGTAVGMGSLSGRSAPFTLVLTGRTPQGQVVRYFELLRSKGQTGLQAQLEGKDLGRFSFAGQVGRTVNFVQVRNSGEGKRLIILFERWLEPFEVRFATRSQNYPFTYIELTMSNSGKGSGQMIGAAKVFVDDDDPDTLTVENFGTYPLRLLNVEMETK
jgi:hypothetical protein